MKALSFKTEALVLKGKLDETLKTLMEKEMEKIAAITTRGNRWE